MTYRRASKLHIALFWLALLIAVLTFCMPAWAAPLTSFHDITGHPQEVVIARWYGYGVIQGYDGAFRPDDTMTQVELELVLARLAGQDEAAWQTSPLLNSSSAGSLIRQVFVSWSGEVPAAALSRAGILALLDSLVGPVEPIYSHAYVEQLSGGFTDTIELTAATLDWGLADFQRVCALPAGGMSAEELHCINLIRDKQLQPSADTLLQKVIPLTDMQEYLNGNYQTPRGFVSICADVKQYRTLADCYYGLRLDYAGTSFTLDADYYGVIRFYAENAASCTIPRSPANGGTVEDPYPFGGAGFTTGTEGRLGSPEWTLPDFAVIGSGGAQLFTIAQDGSEILRGVYNAYAGRFLCITIPVANTGTIFLKDAA